MRKDSPFKCGCFFDRKFFKPFDLKTLLIHLKKLYDFLSFTARKNNEIGHSMLYPILWQRVRDLQGEKRRNSEQANASSASVTLFRCSRTLAKRNRTQKAVSYSMAESEGFEPSERDYRSHDFQSCAFDHSANSLFVLISRIFLVLSFRNEILA